MSFRTILNLVFLLLIVFVAAYVCAFYIIDRDFWWHLKAGELMVQNRALITVEPFSYTLAGKDYGAIHEWLAQVLLYLVHAWGGVTAIIGFRTVLVGASFLVIALISWRDAWPLGLIVLWGIHVNRPSFMDRPQLFTYLIFASFLWLAFRYLAARNTRYLLCMIPLQLLWVNLHGAAGVLGIIIVGLLILQRGYEWHTTRHSTLWLAVRPLALTLIALLAVSWCTPNTYQTFLDVAVLSRDPTLPLVREWQSLASERYRALFIPLWAVTGLALLKVRRDLVFAGGLFILTGYLSLQSYRHLMIFTLSALAVAFYELSRDQSWQKRMSQLARWRVAATSASLVVLAVMGYSFYLSDIPQIIRQGLAGYGVFAEGRGGYEWLETHNVQGKMFNSYNLGGYLLYRGYPERPVFIDGRNVEYGYEFLQETLKAGTAPEAWQALEEKYGFTYALFDYIDLSGQPEVGYAVHLSRSPRWHLVYFDDWTALYLKDTPENQALIEEFSYQVATPQGVRFGTVLDEKLMRDKARQIEQELIFAVAQSPESIRSRLALAQFYLEQNRVQEAYTQAQAAARQQPHRPEVYEVLGRVAVLDEEWAEATVWLEKAIALNRGGPPIDYGYVAAVAAQSGDTPKAEYYMRLEKRHETATAN